jgi:hypothetical protein
MTTCRHAGIALYMLLQSGAARADGERSPMFGISGVAVDTSRTPEDSAQLAGAGIELAWWYGHFGLAGEASGRWAVAPEGARAFVLGGSARLLVLERLVPSFVEPRDDELGVELQAIVERAWWSTTMAPSDPLAYGGGIALRLRGGGDPDDSILLAESRLFVRVLTSRGTELDALARTTAPTSSPSPRAVTVLVGLGASWGVGADDYVRRFRLRPFGP